MDIGDDALVVGASDAAKTAASRLVEAAETNDARGKVSALREAAALTARLNDRPAAERLFRKAIDARQDNESLKPIAIAQASVDYIDDALKTAAMIEHSESDFTQDGRREEALLEVAKAQLKAGDAAGATRSALSITHFTQYCDDALHAIVEFEIRKRNHKGALAAAEKIPNESRRASAMLKIATAYVKSGDRKTAVEIAERIKLTRSLFPGHPIGPGFDYRIPKTWGDHYDVGGAFTGASLSLSGQRVVEVAGCAMTLAQALAPMPEPDYAEAFNEILSGEIVRALARAHAVSGNPREALAWAQRIGSDKKPALAEDREPAWDVERRIYALVGVADGILDRADESRLEPKP